MPRQQFNIYNLVRGIIFMRSNYRKTWDSLYLKVESTVHTLKARRGGRVRRNKVKDRYDFNTKEFKDIVIPYWRKYGIRPKKYWWETFTERDKVMDPRYFPNDLFYGKIVPYYSNMMFRRCSEDKGRHNVSFPNLKRPETIAKNIAGVFYGSNMQIITFEECLNKCLDQGREFVVKPSIDSGHGRLITFCDPNTLTKEKLIQTLEDMKANFIIQKTVKQHSILSQLNPTSLNTVRVMSFLFEGEVHILSCVLRMGASGEKVDNIGARGYACRIMNTGNLEKLAINRQGDWVAENSAGTLFEQIQVPKFKEIIEIVKEEQAKMAHFKIIGWDFAVDEEENPILIEFNVFPGNNQITCGPTFGDLTERVLQDVFIDKSLRHAQN